MADDSRPARVLLLVQDIGSLFDSGIAQQAYFTRKTLQRCGLQVDVGGVNCTVDAYRRVGIATVSITVETDPTQWDLLVFLTTNIDYSVAANRETMERWKAAGVKLVQMLCGNYCYLLQEQFVFKAHSAHGLARSLHNPLVDEYWMLETYLAHRSLLEALLQRPVRVLPYSWNSDIIALHGRDAGLRATCDPEASDGGLIVLVAEPNVSIHKSAMVPLLIADELNRRLLSTGRDDLRVIVLGGREVDHELLAPFLDIYRQRRVEIYRRMPLLGVLDQLRAKRKQVVFVCHHIDNSLNFLHFEAVKLGYPVVHNSEPLRDTGHFYPGFEVDSGVRAATAAVQAEAGAVAERRQREQAVLAEFDPLCARVLDGHRQTIAALLGRTLPAAEPN